MLIFTTTEDKMRKGRLKRGTKKFEVKLNEIATTKKLKLDNAVEAENATPPKKPPLVLCTIIQVKQIATTWLSLMQIL